MAGVAVLALPLYGVVVTGNPMGLEEAEMVEYIPGGSLGLKHGDPAWA